MLSSMALNSAHTLADALRTTGSFLAMTLAALAATPHRLAPATQRAAAGRVWLVKQTARGLAVVRLALGLVRLTIGMFRIWH
jgi:hypothetical protein